MLVKQKVLVVKLVWGTTVSKPTSFFCSRPPQSLPFANMYCEFPKSGFKLIDQKLFQLCELVCRKYNFAKFCLREHLSKNVSAK